MACDELSRACQKVGRFLHDFALVEQEINEGIAAILKLEGYAADVVVNSIPFFNKANLFGTIALGTAPDDEKEGIKTLFNKIADENQNRVLMAHSRFEPAKDEAVQFWRTVAKDRELKTQDQVWSKQKFEQASKRLKKIKDKLAKLKPTLTFEISEEGTRILTHYLYEPGSRWVPLED